MPPKQKQKRDYLIEVFGHTLKQSNKFNDSTTQKIDGRELLDNESSKVDSTSGDSGGLTSIEIVNEDCIEICIRQKLIQPESDLLLLNMASDKKPGGGVAKGSTAQEEHICRCTTLYPNLYKRFYPLSDYEFIHSTNIRILKDGTFSKTKSYPINVISMASIRRPKLISGKLYTDSDYEKMFNKVRILLQFALDNNYKILILGAWGCGAFGNPPEIVAKIFYDQLNGEFKNKFSKVIFSIMENKGSEYLNPIFKRQFERGTI